jgi:hypothetical protein
MKHKYHSRKVRQLDRLIKEMKQAMRDRQPKAMVDRIRQKVAVIIKELRGILSTRQLAHKLGALAFVFGIASSASAQQFAAPIESPFGLTLDSTAYVGGLCLADFDDDGDLDMFMGGYYGTIDYFENVGSAGTPSFAAKQVNPFGLTSAYYYAFLTTADLDDDGDFDIIAGEYYGDYQYYENIGTVTNPLFAASQANPFGITQGYQISMPELADMDGDGDYDLLGGVFYDFNYMENTGTTAAPSFGPMVTNPFGMTFPTSPFASPTIADLDLDGDLDLLVGGYYGNFTYYQNTGTPTNPAFAGQQLNPFGLTGGVNDLMLPILVDIDDDGDLDMLAASYYGSVWFFENTQFNVGIGELENNVAIGPNPFTAEITFTAETDLDLVEILDMTGKIVYSEVSPNGTLNLEQLKRGVYMVQVVDANGRISRQKMEKL